MKKTMDEELNKWRRQFLRSPVSLRIVGDQAYGYLFIGEAYNLLYQLKNSMEFNLINQSQNIRLFNDGTKISASSVYGLDALEIDVSAVPEKAEIALIPSCSVTLLNVPTEIPPMKWYADGKIQPGEVEGIDYIKTYYRIAQENCEECTQRWSICDSNQLTIDIGGTKCYPFRYDKPIEPYNQGDPDAVPPILPDPKNHCVYSLDGGCQAEILKRGSDENGGYFIWKAYTEWSNLNPASITFSATGLGYMLLQILIFSKDGIQLCSDKKIVKVDCCKKNADKRKVEIWWEDFGTCQPFINYRGVTICKMPHTWPIWGSVGLVEYNAISLKFLYAIPEIKGDCLPFIWAGGGAVQLIGTAKDGLATGIMIDPNTDCKQDGSITLTDRCGSAYTVKAQSCCEVSLPLSISYTSLLMSCGHQQDLSNIGGCPPYSWAIIAGAGSLSAATGSTVTYTAPATNVNCLDNPTIILTDCCGNSAQIKLAVNCYVGGYSLGMNDRVTSATCHCYECSGGYPDAIVLSAGGGKVRMRRWDCDGSLTYTCTTASDQLVNNITYPYYSSCTQPVCPSPCIGFVIDSGYCLSISEGGCLNVFQCGTGECGSSGGACGELVDERSADIKAQGCCPLNPITGLPY